MGNILLNYENEENEALAYFRSLVNQYPDNGYYRRLLVRTLSSLNRNSEVHEAVDNAVKRWSDKEPADRRLIEEELLFWKGRAYYRMNNFREALASFQSAIDRGSSLPNRTERLYYSVANYYAGLSSEALNNDDRAREYYSEALDQNVEGDFISKARERLRAL
jgi:tetratricopeptide (TPR) repeat protein